MNHSRIILQIAVLLSGPVVTVSAADTLQPFLAKNCYGCHNARVSTAGLNLETLSTAAVLDKDRNRWELILSKIESGEMPPKGMPRPDPPAVQSLSNLLKSEFALQDKLIKPDPGHITAHRLNKAEYNNTVRDLLGVDFHPATDFPPDDSGYGFDNIGDVLSLSPILMEKYLTAAEKISRTAMYGEPAPAASISHRQVYLRRPPAPPSLFEYDQDGLSLPSALNVLHTFPADGEYLLKITFNGQRPNGSEPVTAAVWVDGKQIQTVLVEQNDMEGQSREFRTRIAKGDHLMSVTFLRQFEGLPAALKGPNPSSKTPSPRGRGPAPAVAVPQAADADAPAVGGTLAGGRGPGRGGAVAAGGAAKVASYAGRVDALDIGGPFDAKPEPPTVSLGKILTCGHIDGQHNDSCPRKILSDLARRAYRRPASSEEVSDLLALYAKVRKSGDSFEEGIATAMQYVLVSPDFLFRIEKDPKAPGAHAVSNYELASRLSYFLWSSMPDDELLRAAEQGKLRNAPVLDAQVRRMLRDPKSKALVDNFAGQWLEIRNMDIVKPDWERFEQFDDLLRVSAKRETELFLSHIIREDRSILEMIDGKYSFLNERLARFYGVPGVKGPEFRQVDLSAFPQRGGLLTHASVLTVSSYATRTSPVLRGKWILENILNTPPPPPPPNVPDLEADGAVTSMSLRQQMEKHRANPACAGCHARMDPLGFSLENYDAIGSWRSEDGKFPIDASGRLPDGKTFTGAEGLKTVLSSDREAFARTVTEKLMIYGLGRGVERFDKPVIAGIVSRAAPANYRFSEIVLGIVHSMPFEMRKRRSE